MAGSAARIARWCFYRAGGLTVGRWLNRNGLRILMYHRFSDRAALEAQCRHLRKHYRPLSLSAAADHWKAGTPLPPNSLVVTVDDGHRDFWDIAYPVFSAYGIPATVYLVTDFLDRRLWLWTDQVRYAFEHSPLTQVRIESGAGGPVLFPLGNHAQRQQGARANCNAWKLLPNGERLAALARLAEWFQVEIPEQPPAGCQPLTWDEVRTMARNGIEFGAHTRTHPVLSRVISSAELTSEIAGSRCRIEEAIDSPVRHFCYPNGTEPDIGPEAVAAVRQAGFDTAVTTQPGINSGSADPLLLRRIGVDPGYEPDYFARCATGFWL